ncbi:MAG: STAS domain-containing protein [Bdellovibrionota bacterium]
MKTQIRKNGDTVTVSMDGKLNFETSIPLREDLAKLMSKLTNMSGTDSVPKKIVFNFEKLDFVGSSGISSFVQTLKDFNSLSPVKPQYHNVKNEFQRVIKAFDETALFEFYEDGCEGKKILDQ